MWLTILLLTLGDDANGLTFGIWKLSVGLEHDVADFSGIWASQGLVEDDLSGEGLLWLESVVWHLTLIVDVVDLCCLLRSVLNKRTDVQGSNGGSVSGCSLHHGVCSTESRWIWFVTHVWSKTETSLVDLAD